MKTYIIFMWLIIFASAGLGQETKVPDGECRIFLNTGTKIENVQLRKIDTIKVEYIKSGNLHDTRVNEINSIETSDQILYFDKHHRVRFRNYDQLILHNEDTIRGMLMDINDNYISIRLKSTTKIKKYWLSEVEETILGTDTLDKSHSEIVPVVEPKLPDTLTHLPARNEFGMGNTYYLDSYQRGTADADSIRTGGWGTGGFLLGLCYGSAYLTLGAINSKVENLEVPQGVDASLYKEGFKSQLIHKRSRSAAAGAATAKAIVTVILVIAIASGL